MSYVLVCLVGDEATKRAERFARWLAEQRAPSHAWFEEHPPIDAVAKAVNETGALIIIGHNGELNGRYSLRAHAGHGVWADDVTLGPKFAGARIYTWACSTQGKGGTRLPEVKYLGDLACEAGARAVAGHSITVPSDLDALDPSGFGRQSLAAAIFGFLLEGIHDERELRRRAQEVVPLSINLAASAADAPWPTGGQVIEDLLWNLHVSVGR